MPLRLSSVETFTLIYLANAFVQNGIEAKQIMCHRQASLKVSTRHKCSKAELPMGNKWLGVSDHDVFIMGHQEISAGCKLIIVSAHYYIIHHACERC